MDLITGETAAMVLAGFAAFAAITALALPSDADPKLQARLRSVAREREHLREKRLADLAARSRTKVRQDGPALIARLVRRFRDEERSANGGLMARLRMAGFRSAGAEALFLFLRAATPIVLFLATFAALALYPHRAIAPSTVLTFAVAAAAAGYSLPRIALDRLIARRQRLILRAFPDALDLLLICVQSGMSVEAALAKVTKDISAQCIELAEELSLTMAELSYLPVRWRAYANLGERIGAPSVKLITTALVQAERHGTSISQALAAAARDGREARIAEAERKAATLPPLLAVPLVAFFLPVLLTVILAPAIIQAGDALSRSGSLTAKPAQSRATPSPGAPSSPTPRRANAASAP
jgi:tight adherence protein C